jgi:inward rectifier potassium channel
MLHLVAQIKYNIAKMHNIFLHPKEYICNMAKKTDQVLEGFDTNAGKATGRLFSKDGQPNVIRTGATFLDRFSIYHTLLNISLRKYIFLIFVAYFIINLIFASIYFMLGAEKLGIDPNYKCNLNAFNNCFFFSAQTLTTVGYGRISPTEFSTSAVSAIESLLGLLLFSVITGLSYARFAKPKSKVMFSNNLLISPFQNGKAIMFRMVSPSEHVLSNVEVTVTLAILEDKNGKMMHQFYTLKLEANKIITFPLNWTIVHEIDQESPLANVPFSEFENRKIEFIVFMKAYDENYSNHVQQRTSYTYREVIDNAKFISMFYTNQQETARILEIDKLSEFEILKS